MLRVVEHEYDNSIVYDLLIEDNGKIISRSLIKYQIADVIIGDQHYYYIYDQFMNPIRETFNFLNFALERKTMNTKYVYMNALKFLYCFEEIIGLQLKDFSPINVEAFKDFLQGICRPGNTFVFENLTERSSETVNQYLGVYRSFLAYKNEENKYLQVRGHNSARYRVAVDRSIGVSQGYKTNIKTLNSVEIPRYISVDDYAKIIKHIRQQYTMREECIVRLMYETGMRIGEVLGLTNEDVVNQKFGENYYNCVYIRNRLTDKRYQMAKTTMKVISRKEYKSKAYRTANAGFQRVFITDELYELIGQYIDIVHNEARDSFSRRYMESTKADSVNGETDNFYIFINAFGSRLSNVTWDGILRKIFEEVGIQVDKRIRDNNLNHRFRHGFAMFQIQYRHIDAVQLANMMRHKSVSSVMKYYRPTISDKIRLKENFTQDLYGLIPDLREVTYGEKS